MSGIFISYRRSDNPDATGRIYDCLVAAFGKARVFKDVDSIPLGRDFRGHLNEIVGDCVVVLAIVGPRWTDAHNEAGQRRLEDPDDFVRIELEAAMARSIPVVPVLVGHALMPGSAQLPASLAQLAFRQSIEVRPDPDFHHDATRLVSALRAMLDPNAPQEEEQASIPASESPRGRWPWMAALGISVAGMIAFAVPGIRHLREIPVPVPPETRTEIVTPATDDPMSFALSPDGRQIVFVASGDGASRLWLRSLATTKAEPLMGTEGASYPFWSPNGRSIGFFAERALKRLDIGGVPEILAAAPRGAGGTWSADNVIVFSPVVASPLMRVPAAGGVVAPATTLGPQQLSHLYPFFLPDGRFLFRVNGAPDVEGVYLGALAGGTPTRLTPGSLGGYLSTGWLVWMRTGTQTLVAQRLDLAQGALTGEPVALADGVTADNLGRIAVSAAAGLVSYRTGTGIQLQLKWFDRAGTVRGTVGESDGNFLQHPRLSPDGRRVVASRMVQGNMDLWLLDADRASRFTFDADRDQYPIWSPDGTRIVFRSTRTGSGDLYQKSTSGAGGDEKLVTSDQPEFPGSWSVDGRFLLFSSVDAQTGQDLRIMPMTGNGETVVFLKTPFHESNGMFSPDGRWVAYQSNESGRYEIYVRPFVPPDATRTAVAAVEGQWQVSTAGGIHPTWRRDGKELYYINPARAMMAAPITVTGAALVLGTPMRLFPTHIEGGGEDIAGRQYDTAPDGRFLINTVLDTTAAPITLIQNWNPEAP